MMFPLLYLSGLQIKRKSTAKDVGFHYLINFTFSSIPSPIIVWKVAAINAEVVGSAPTMHDVQ